MLYHLDILKGVGLLDPMAKTIQELCLKANLTAFESQSKLICDICHHEDLNDENARKQGEFTSVARGLSFPFLDLAGKKVRKGNPHERYS